MTSIIILPQQQSLYILNHSSTAYLTAYSNNVCQPHNHHVYHSNRTGEYVQCVNSGHDKKLHWKQDKKRPHFHQHQSSSSVCAIRVSGGAAEKSKGWIRVFLLDRLQEAGLTFHYLHTWGGASVTTDSQRTGRGLRWIWTVWVQNQVWFMLALFHVKG